MLDANGLPGGGVQLVLKGYHGKKTCPKPARQVGCGCQPGLPGLDKDSGKELGGCGTWRISQTGAPWGLLFPARALPTARRGSFCLLSACGRGLRARSLKFSQQPVEPGPWAVSQAPVCHLARLYSSGSCLLKAYWAEKGFASHRRDRFSSSVDEKEARPCSAARGRGAGGVCCLPAWVLPAVELGVRPGTRGPPFSGQSLSLTAKAKASPPPRGAAGSAGTCSGTSVLGTCDLTPTAAGESAASPEFPGSSQGWERLFKTFCGQGEQEGKADSLSLDSGNCRCVEAR